MSVAKTMAKASRAFVCQACGAVTNRTDGFFRSLSVADGEEGYAGYFGPHAAPIVGRVSMDLAVLDVSRVPAELARRGALVELIGPNVPAHELAHHAGTIDYEVLTNLGRRAFRRYVGG